MGLRDMRANAIAAQEEKQAEKAGHEERNANPEQVWEYKALSLLKTFGPALEGDFNKLGRQGWEFVAHVADKNVQGYAIFKRQV